MFAGLISKEQNVLAWGDQARILAALAPYSMDAPRNVWATDRQLLLQMTTRAGAKSAAIYQHPESGVAVAFWGRLDNRTELISTLVADHKNSNDELIALAWLKWGEYCPEKLIGDFAFAVASPKTGVVFLARDVMGVKPLFYRSDEHGVFFASSASAFKAVLLGKLTRRPEWMARYMVDLSASHTDTAYEEIKKLPAAHCLLIHADGRTNLRRYHQFIDDAPVEFVRNAHWLEEYRDVWQKAIACRIPLNEPLASENSGGIDSGSITAEIARQLGEDVDRLYGMAHCRSQQEPEFIMATAMKYRMKNSILMSHDASLTWPNIRQREHCIHGYPQEHPDGSFHVPFYEVCQQNGIRVLHSGFGGDEGVTYPGGMPARLQLLDQGNWSALWRVLPGNAPVRAARLAKTLWHSINPPEHFAPFMSTWRNQQPYRFLHSDAVSRHNIENEFLATATYDERFRTVNEAVIHLLSRSLVSTRLEACTQIAAAYGIDYVWPLLDVRLIQQWLSTPTIWKVGDGGVGRYLHRCAINGVAADKVAWKPRKDMGVSAVIHEAENADNTPILRHLLSLCERLPIELESIVDIPKAKAIAARGIQESWNGALLHFTLEESVGKLENLIVWLERENT